MKSTIFWNCRGLGNASSIHALVSLVRKFSTSILFLSETKCNKKEIRKIKDRLLFDHCICVEALGRAGGLALFWLDEVDVRILSFDNHHIDCEVSEDGGRLWRLTGVYGWFEGGEESPHIGYDSWVREE